MACNVQAAVWELEFRLPKTEVDDCNIADVLFISQIYNVKLELKLNSSTNVEAYSVCPNCSKPLVGSSVSYSDHLVHWTIEIQMLDDCYLQPLLQSLLCVFGL
jgi:hypothetical protein